MTIRELIGHLEKSPDLDQQIGELVDGTVYALAAVLCTNDGSINAILPDSKVLFSGMKIKITSTTRVQ